MKGACVLGKAIDTQKIGCGAATKCLLFMLVVLSVLNPAMLPPFGIENGTYVLFYKDIIYICNNKRMKWWWGLWGDISVIHSNLFL
jgi:hypothetical protein